MTSVDALGLKFKAQLIPIENITDLFPVPNRAYLDYEKTGANIKLRYFRSGDSFIPLGMKGRKKLKTFFIDEKIPYNKRMSVPLLTSIEGSIIWIYGKRIGENYRVTDMTSKVLMLEGEKY